MFFDSFKCFINDFPNPEMANQHHVLHTPSLINFTVVFYITRAHVYGLIKNFFNK